MNLIKPKIPPLTIHGTKTQSIPFIFKTITWDAKGKWVEGFLGAGTTFFNAIFHGRIREAYATELDPNIVSFYNDIKLNNIINFDSSQTFEESKVSLSEFFKNDHYGFRGYVNSIRKGIIDFQNAEKGGDIKK